MTRWRVVDEPQKGTGAAADTGMRAAIAQDATHLARTDADCLPLPDWTRRVRAAFASGHDLVAGRLVPRTDDRPVSRVQQGVLSAAVSVASTFGRFRPGNQDPSTSATTSWRRAATWRSRRRCTRRGRVPAPRSRTSTRTGHRHAVRRLTRRYGAHRDVVVRASTRRAHAWGPVRTLGWYADHRYRPELVDIR